MRKGQLPEKLTGMDAVMAAGGEAGRLMSEVDWARTPVGPVSTWPESLRTAVSICMASRFPMVVWWGPELVFMFNEAYRPLLGTKDARSIQGGAGEHVWPEIWAVIGPMLMGVVAGGESTWSEDQMLLLARNGYFEECYFTFSFSAIRDESGGIGGVFTAALETTLRVVNERRLTTLSEVAEASAQATEEDEVCRWAAEALASNRSDIPFAFVYLLDDEGKPVLAGSSHDAAESALIPAGSLAEVAATGSPQTVDLPGASADLPPELGLDVPPRQALVLPIPKAGEGRSAGVLVAGISARRALDDSYRRFFGLVAAAIGSALGVARAHEEEWRRAEGLAELNRVKTAFFSNISHELRTPLTLLLGPLERAIPSLPSEHRGDLELAHRNALRLLRLVNALLDFSRLEAGRIDALYSPIALARQTAELASSFRSAIEAAGMTLTVDCPPLLEPAYVDLDMWEKVVANLLVNAFKFTFEGGVTIATRMTADAFELTVADTGVGIALDELPRVFERFQRIRNTRSRTHEGTGIGLSLVRELVELHGGTVAVASVPGQGTTFTVAIPRGSEHLPAHRVTDAPTGSRTSGVASFVAETLRWQPVPAVVDHGPEAAQRGTVLIVDDNADMRDYLAGLLSPHWHVVLVPDGGEALRYVGESLPDLVLTDVMMPGMDGFEFLRRLREDSRTRSVPVLMLSARAGDEAAVEGLEAGADDYLVKPFAARELVARVRANLELSRMRAETAFSAAEAARLAELETIKSDFLNVASHELRSPISVLRGYLGMIADGSLGELPAGVIRVLPILSAKADRMNDLVTQMLDAARLEDGKLALAWDPLDIRAVVRSSVSLIHPLLPSSHSLEVELPAEPITVLGDHFRLETVITNMIENAVRYSPHGGLVHIGCALGPGPVEVSISVRDQGLGIASDDLERIFVRFGRIVTAENSHIEGSGLGLYLSSQLAQMHGGRMTVESQPCVGSTFTVILPLAAGR